MNNPYESLDWQTAIRIPSATHTHMTSQLQLDNARRHGLKHFPISNYYPSVPCSACTRPGDFRLRQSWPSSCNGVPIPPPINWNDIITWEDELEDEYRRQIPFAETGPFFTDVPSDIILSKNAEHHSFRNSRSHITCPGSALCSGNFDARSRFRLREHGYPMGYGGTWQDAFADMIKSLDYPDGGGIIINHPTWSRMKDAEVDQMLAFDERVLGMEIYNDTVAAGIRDGKYPAEDGEPDPGYSINMWDRILAGGRRCYGFCVPDHRVSGQGDWLGRIILLVPEFTERACLQACRKGQFYGRLKDNGLSVTELSATPRRVSVSVNRSARIRFIADARLALAVEGRQAAFDVPQRDGAPGITYVRVEVADDSGERLFLQPIMFRRQ